MVWWILMFIDFSGDRRRVGKIINMDFYCYTRIFLHGVFCLFVSASPGG